MPTPVTTARQCLTEEAAQALDEAVAVARRRAHAQTTSLHAISGLLSLPSSSLRDACGHARNSAYSSRIQFKALELCLGVSLDRLSSSAQRADEPPVSNSFMAAIKRSQANQRRHPENFQFYQQQSISTVKVELQNLILSILDDPVVSRVFNEAGFRSCDIKFAIIRPVHRLLRYSGYKGQPNPPMFLCNFNGDSDLGRRGFSFPFLGFSGCSDNDENYRRIGEVFVREKGRNPLLLGVCALDTLTNFSKMIQAKKGGVVFPKELSGLSVIHIENEVMNFVTENCDAGLKKLRIEEVGREIEQCIGPGVVINFGNLKALVGDDASVDAVSYIIRELARLLELHGGKVWLIGATARHETYLEFLNKFPSIEKDWDLQLLPITSPRPHMGETYPKSSLIESFVPFGGFFSTPSGMKSSLSSSYQCVSRCHLCNEKCEQEVTALSKGGYTTSVADQYQSSLPSWLQMTELGTNSGLDAVKAKDVSMVLSAKVAGLQKKWDNICQRLHFTQLLPKADSYHISSEGPGVAEFQAVEYRKEDNVSDHSRKKIDAPSTNSGCKNINSCRSMDLQQNFTPKLRNVNFLSKLSEKDSKIEDELGGLRSPCSLSSSSVGDGWTSPTSATSVTTDLGLGINSAWMGREPEKPTNQNHTDHLQEFSGCSSANFDAAASITNHPAQSLSCSCPDFHGQFEQKDFKMLYMSLANRIGRQEEAISAISQTLVNCRTRTKKCHAGGRGDIWFNFLGPDRLGKKKIAVALAEILYGSRENFICVDLSFQDGTIHRHSKFDQQQINVYDIKFRGKTLVDYIAEELRKKPSSVVYLENIDKADLQIQNSLSRAVRTGRFLDSYGRDVSIGNAIFVTTSTFTEGNKILSSVKETTNYLEEKVLRAKGWPIQMFIGFDLGDNVLKHNSRVLDITRKGSSNPISMNKRKLIGTNETVVQCQTVEMAKRAHKGSNRFLDLNLPAEEGEVSDVDYGNSDMDSSFENSWLEDIFGQVDQKVIFKPFDFDALAEKILMEINGCFHKIFGSEGLLDIDSKVMEQILAAVYLLDNNSVDNWVEQVLGKAFVEAQKRYNLSSHSVVKLVTREGIFPDEQAPGIFLPARIIMN